MKYPVISKSDCESLAVARNTEEDIDESKIQFAGSGKKIDEYFILRASNEIEKLIADRPRKNMDKTEGEASVILYEGINQALGSGAESISLNVLDDPGFWRYLCLFRFWNFVQWRQWEYSHKFHESIHMVYIDGEVPSECVVSRMYLRVAVLGGLEHKALASCLDNSTDFWRSHILRVRNSSVPSLTRALVKFQRDKKLNTDSIRALAKKIRQVRQNIEFVVCEESDAMEFLESLYRSNPHDQ